MKTEKEAYIKKEPADRLLFLGIAKLMLRPGVYKPSLNQ